jgi:hypothetical protein
MKNKKSNDKRFSTRADDLDAMKGKGTRKENRRAKRYKEKQGLDDIARGNIDPDEYMDYMDELNS